MVIKTIIQMMMLDEGDEERGGWGCGWIPKSASMTISKQKQDKSNAIWIVSKNDALVKMRIGKENEQEEERERQR